MKKRPKQRPIRVLVECNERLGPARDGFWGFTTEYPVDGGEDLMYPISIRELARCKIKYTSPALPDGVSAKIWNKVPDRVKAKLFTIWLRVGRVPESVLESRTIFLPKKEETVLPSDTRPISISSVVLRHFHKLLTGRLSELVEPKLDSKQCGFRPRDGIAFCISQLDRVLTDTRNEKRGLCLVSLDLCKAFDSISHQAIFYTLESMGLDKKFISYLRYVYGNGRTRLTYGGEESAPILPGRGVRQGDPLSPLIFNVVFDNVLRSVPDQLGLRCRGEWVSKLAFADDLVLCAENAVDLQHVLDMAMPVVRACGLKVNEQKSVSLTWLACGKDKRRIYDHRPTLN
ncbi:hypothetical protein JTE90_026098 [Oedothorax gibbosus]|uniref:Reverse transcriptase domain-containing protein n=1 Tax=Oedothorax gibbosus TaxID=931172 RepID=A0AAV6TLW5_9ARAC|nr:hypothetical protein JTE90_026098 [Oedothorax gibbosus]